MKPLNNIVKHILSLVLLLSLFAFGDVAYKTPQHANAIELVDSYSPKATAKVHYLAIKNYMIQHEFFKGYSRFNYENLLKFKDNLINTSEAHQNRRALNTINSLQKTVLTVKYLTSQGQESHKYLG